MVVYNLLFYLAQRRRIGRRRQRRAEYLFAGAASISISLTLLLYFADLPRNPFLFFFVFHMIIAGMYLRGKTPYFFAAFSTLAGRRRDAVALSALDPRASAAISLRSAPRCRRPTSSIMLGVFAAFAGALWMALYFTTSIRRYVDRAHAEIRQKEKMLGIGQLVAGIAHQIANPLDGVQNCLRRIGEGVKDDPHLTEYVQLMAEALERIERTAKRVQAFARPRGITLQSTDVNQAVEGTLDVLGRSHGRNIRIQQGIGRRGPGPRRPVHACRKCSSISARTP